MILLCLMAKFHSFSRSVIASVSAAISCGDISPCLRLLRLLSKARNDKGERNDGRIVITRRENPDEGISSFSLRARARPFFYSSSILFLFKNFFNFFLKNPLKTLAFFNKVKYNKVTIYFTALKR